MLLITIVDNYKNTWLPKILFVYLSCYKELKNQLNFKIKMNVMINKDKLKPKKETLEISLFSRYKD